MYTFLALTIKTKVNDQSISQLEHTKKVALVSSELEDGCQKRVEIKRIPSYSHTQATTAQSQGWLALFCQICGHGKVKYTWALQ
jgi:hypothetical protein